MWKEKTEEDRSGREEYDIGEGGWDKGETEKIITKMANVNIIKKI